MSSVTSAPARDWRSELPKPEYGPTVLLSRYLLHGVSRISWSGCPLRNSSAAECAYCHQKDNPEAVSMVYKRRTRKDAKGMAVPDRFAAHESCVALVNSADGREGARRESTPLTRPCDSSAARPPPGAPSMGVLMMTLMSAADISMMSMIYSTRGRGAFTSLPRAKDRTRCSIGFDDDADIRLEDTHCVCEQCLDLCSIPFGRPVLTPQWS